MIRHHDIPWFNPRQMDDATVRALSTGREDLLHDFFLLARQRLLEPSAGKHWLVLGPRGAGKSFFLRLVQCRFTEAMNLEGKTAGIVLLPEEQPNVFAPHEWLQEVQRLLPGQTHCKGQSPVWQVKDEGHAWQTALQSLLDGFKGDLLVIAVENFDLLLAQAFDNDVRASRLRNLMENEPRIMLLASAVEGEFDEAYEKRLFRQFEHHQMPRWDERDHRDYLTRRAKLQGKEPTNRQLAKIDAYSRFTGGSARTAAVIAASILEEQGPLSASHDLMATLDRMSDYYRALIEKMPPNTRKIFDNLVRGGEPASQVELANRIQARQSDISKAFRWLTDYGYVINEKQPGSKEHSYRVADRMFAQFYRLRYVQPDRPCDLALLADLIALSSGNKDNAEQLSSASVLQEASFVSGLAGDRDPLATARRYCDLVYSALRGSDQTGAFMVARKLLADHAAKSPTTALAVIAALWIEMTDRGLPLTLLRDLLHEVPYIFMVADDSLSSLSTTLEAWLDYLAASPEKRTVQLRRIDPDLAATLEGLSKNLSPKARLRFGLITPIAGT